MKTLSLLSLTLLAIGMLLPQQAAAQFGDSLRGEAIMNSTTQRRLELDNPGQGQPAPTYVPQSTSRGYQDQERAYRDQSLQNSRGLRAAMKDAMSGLQSGGNTSSRKETPTTGITDGNWQKRHSAKIRGAYYEEPRRESKGLLESFGSALGNVANREEQYLERTSRYGYYTEQAERQSRRPLERMGVPTTLAYGDREEAYGSGSREEEPSTIRRIPGMAVGVGKSMASVLPGVGDDNNNRQEAAFEEDRSYVDEAPAASTSRSVPFSGLIGNRSAYTGGSADDGEIFDGPPTPSGFPEISDELPAPAPTPRRNLFGARTESSGLFPDEPAAEVTEDVEEQASGAIFSRMKSPFGREKNTEAEVAAAPQMGEVNYFKVKGRRPSEFYPYASNSGRTAEALPVNPGTVLKVTSVGEEWSSVELPSGMKGIMKTTELSRASAAEYTGSPRNVASSEPRSMPSLSSQTPAPAPASSPSTTGSSSGGSYYAAPREIPLPELPAATEEGEVTPLGQGILAPLPPSEP